MLNREALAGFAEEAPWGAVNLAVRCGVKSLVQP